MRGAPEGEGRVSRRAPILVWCCFSDARNISTAGPRPGKGKYRETSDLLSHGYRKMGFPFFTESSVRKTGEHFYCCTDSRHPRGCSSLSSLGFPIANTSSRLTTPASGHSNWPDPKRFAYTFDHIAEIMNPFTEALGLSRYTLYRAGLRRPRGFSHGPGASGPDRGPDRGAAASCAQRRLGGELECDFVILSP
jgi:hypothetical protein